MSFLLSSKRPAELQESLDRWSPQSLNMMVPGPGEGIRSPPHLEPDGPAASSSGARWLKPSLFVGISIVGFYLISGLWIAAHRRFWYDEISAVLIARVPNFATIWRALSSAADVLPPSYFILERPFDRALGPTELAARIPSALVLAAGLLITLDCAWRLTDNLQALASVALLSCSLPPYDGYKAKPLRALFHVGGNGVVAVGARPLSQVDGNSLDARA